MKFVKVFNTISVEVEANKIEEAFERLAAADEIFGNNICGNCGSENTGPISREVDGNKYYEMGCKDCHAKLAFGQLKGGGLFPRRKDSDGNRLENNGWTIYRPGGQKEAPPQKQSGGNKRSAF